MSWALDSLVLGVLLVLALSGVIILALAYLRVRTKRLLFLTIAMLFFLVKAALLLTSLYVDSLGFMAEGHYHVLFDVGVVVLLMISGLWE